MDEIRENAKNILQEQIKLEYQNENDGSDNAWPSPGTGIGRIAFVSSALVVMVSLFAHKCLYESKSANFRQGLSPEKRTFDRELKRAAGRLSSLQLAPRCGRTPATPFLAFP